MSCQHQFIVITSVVFTFGICFQSVPFTSVWVKKEKEEFEEELFEEEEFFDEQKEEFEKGDEENEEEFEKEDEENEEEFEDEVCFFLIKRRSV